MASDPVEVLRSALGYPDFRPGQEVLVRAALEGRDALGVLPTGGGKSVCYQVPALILEGLVLVVTPLISLMEDQVVRARAIGLRAASLSAAQPSTERSRIRAQAVEGRLDLLFVSPERLETASFAAVLEGADVRLLAVDEAHCISEWGHDFRPAYRRIGAVARRLECATLALTASATPAVRADIRESLGLRSPREVVHSFDRTNLHWMVRRGGSIAQRTGMAVALLRSRPGNAIVYAPTRRAVETVRDRLARSGLHAEAYHAGLPGGERSRVQERFMSGGVPVVVATNAFGMGIDKPDVRTVIHVQLPTTLEAYYQEGGRAGRDGRPSVCLAFHDPRDQRLGRSFVNRTNPPARALRRLHRRLVAIGGRCAEVSTDDPRLIRALGGVPRAWIDGDPVGPLGALERAGALVRGGEGGTGGRPSVSFTGTEVVGTILVRPAFDPTVVRRHRRRCLERLRAVRRYARTRGCRSEALLRYFGEICRKRCGRCDRCGWALDSG